MTLFRTLTRALALFSLLAFAAGAATARPITMATKGFTEQHILSAMTTLWLTKRF